MMTKKRETDPSFASTMNEREISKDHSDINSTMNSSFFRDQLFELNAQRMFKVNKNLRISYRVTLIMQLIIAYCMCVGFFYKFLNTFYWLIYSPGSAQYMTTGCLIAFPTALLGIVMTIIANKWFNRNCCIVLLLCMVVYGFIGLFAIMGKVDDIGRFGGFLMFTASLIGGYMANLTRSSFDELDYLVTQEGFPTFNSSMFSMHRSRYVRFRERWEKKHRTSTGYSEFEKPTENIIVTEAEAPDRMDGISANANSCEEWFSDNKVKAEEQSGEILNKHAMDGLSYESAISDDDNYYIEQANPTKKRVL